MQDKENNIEKLLNGASIFQVYHGEPITKIGTMRIFDLDVIRNDNPYVYLGELDGWLIWREFDSHYGGGSPILLKFRPESYPKNVKRIWTLFSYREREAMIQKPKDEYYEIYDALKKKYPGIFDVEDEDDDDNSEEEDCVEE